MATQYLKKIINPKGIRGFRYSGKEAPSGWQLGVDSGLCPLCLLNIYSRNLEAKIVWTDDASTTMCTTETQTDATESNKKEEVPPEDCTSMSSRVHTDAHNQEHPEQQIEEVVEEEAEAMVPPMRPTMVLRSSTRHQTKISSLQQIVKPIKNKKMATQYLKKIINPKGCRGYRYSGKQARAVGRLGVQFRALSSLPTEHLLQADNAVR